MNSQHGSNPPAILTALTLALVLQAGARPAAAADDGTGLKWTPHRASTPIPLEAEELAALAGADESLEDQPAGPPASVILPDQVPVAAPPARQPRTASVPAATRASTGRSAAGQPGSGGIASRIYDPSKPDAVFGVRVLRTPPPPAGRSPQTAAAGARRPPAPQTRLGGGLAPRFGSAAGQRPERLAMNVDGIPSVMKQAPQVGGLDDATVPGRVPPGAGARDRLPTPAEGSPPDVESIGPGLQLPDDGYGSDGPGGDGGSFPGGDHFEGGLLMGDYPTELHVESFYDDPYACEDDEGLLTMCASHGRICSWLRQFGRPYYGWQWYRDFTASAGITSFTNATDLGLNGNFGTNEYLNWSMPFWNAFGVGWQVGWRGVQTNFQPATIEAGGVTLQKTARDQQFLTTGFFTRAFEGRGLQGGIVYDYVHDSWFENTDLAQLRYEFSYVWGYHEFGFWGASNIADQIGIFGRKRQASGVADTLTLYTGFYRVQFGDANEWKVWGGGTDEQDGIVGTLVRAPLHKSLAVEGTFTYVIPNRNHVVTLGDGATLTRFSPAAWNLGLNLVWYPAARSRRSLASPYRPLFEVADNGSMIRSLEGLLAP